MHRYNTACFVYYRNINGMQLQLAQGTEKGVGIALWYIIALVNLIFHKFIYMPNLIAPCTADPCRTFIYGGTVQQSPSSS